MSDAHLLQELIFLLAIAAAGVAVFERLGLPSVAGFLVMGALVGPGGLGLVADPDRVRALAELGVVFLLFEIGLELPIDRIRRMWRRSFLAGGLQVGGTLVVVAGLAVWSGLDSGPAIVLGALVAMSSTALVIRLLSDRGEIDAPHGQLALGVLLFQDLCIVPLLLLVPLIASGVAASPWPMLLAFGRAGAALAVFFLVARFVLPALLAGGLSRRSRDLFSILALLIVLGSAVAAEEMGLTLAVGAFIAGLVMSTSPYSHQLFAEVLPLRGVLLGIFFTAVGMLLDPVDALREWPSVLGYVAGVVVLKAVVVFAVVAWLLRQGLRLGILAGLALAQTGEFSFVLAGVAREAGLLDERLGQVFVAGSFVTLIATPFLLDVAPAVARFLASGVERAAGAGEPASEELEDHVVVVGYGIAGQSLARVLRALQIRHVAVEANAQSVREAGTRQEPVVFGDATRSTLLDRVGVARARLVVVAISDAIATQHVAEVVRSLAPDVPLVVRTRFVSEVDALFEAGASAVVAEEFESTLDLIAKSLRVFQIPDSAIARFTAELREEGYEPLRASPGLALDPWLAELLAQVGAEWLEVPDDFAGERTLGDLSVRPRTGANVLAVDRAGVVTTSPDATTPLRAGDRVLAFGSPDSLLRLSDLLGIDPTS